MPKVVDREREKQQILAACLPLLARRGYTTTTMRQLAAAAGMSTGKLYHYFPTKEALFQGIVEQATARNIAGFTAGVAPDAGPAERLAALFAYVEAREPELQQLLLLVLDYYRRRTEPEPRAFLAGAMRIYQEALAGAVTGGDERLAGFVLSQVFGHLLRRLVDPGVASPAEHMALLAPGLFSAR